MILRRLLFFMMFAVALAVSRPTHAQSPRTAAEAIDLAAAAYEYGDMIKVVDCARPVTEGALPSTAAQRATALRLLGVGLYLTDRKEGAHAAFFEWLRVAPTADLDPTVTRPEVVAFFKDIRRRHQADIARSQAAVAASRKNFAWNFVPPAGQFQNGDAGRAWALLAVEAAALGAAVTTRLVLRSWQGPYHDFGEHESAARTLKTWNAISVGVLGAAVAAGILDGVLRFAHVDTDDGADSRVSLAVSPFGAALHLSF